ncbi:MAG TPA: MFS transporter [Methylomirabilota bacterium]|nr:MFS transporter [Methylomirabilota bacterium]
MTVLVERPPASSLVRGPSAALAGTFFLNGLVLASWVAHIPAVKAAHGLGDGPLGLVLLAMAAGAVAALPVAAGLVARWGSRAVTAGALGVLALALPAPLLAPAPGLVAAGLALLGAASATLDVGMNAQAVALEAALGRPILSRCHGLFSLGGLAGAALASGAMGLGVPDRAHVAGVALACLALIPGVQRSLLAAGPTPGPRPPIFAVPPRRLVGLGLLTFCALLAEGAIGDWSAVYLHDTLGAAPAASAAGFAAFSLAMAAGRLGGDHVLARLGARRLLRGASAVAAVGLAAALGVGDPGLAIVGLGLVGLGLANAVPVLFGAAGRVGGIPPGTALAAVATTGYGGFLAGPPLIGALADAAGLSVALGVVVAALALLAAGAPALPCEAGRGRP